MDITSNGFYKVFDWISKFAILNALWVIINIPVLLLVLLAVATNVEQYLLETAAFASVLLPFLFFPATAALFSSVRDMVMGTRENKMIFRFFGYLKENYKKSALSGIYFTALWLIWTVGYLNYFESNIIFQFAMLGLGMPLFIASLYYFVINAHYDISIKQTFTKVFLLTFGNIPLSLMMFGVTLLILYVSVNGWLVLLLFFSAAVTAFILFSMFYRFYVSVHAHNA